MLVPRPRFARSFLAAAISLALLVAASPSTAVPTSTPLIVGGSTADPADFGFIAAVLDADSYRKSGAYQAQFCAASLTTPTTMVTAAHCVVDQKTARRTKPGEILVAFGSDLRSPSLRVIGVDDIRVHPDYRIKTTQNDVAVLHLSQPVTDYPAIGLPSGTEVAVYSAPGTSAKVAGWGNTRPRGNRYPPELQAGNVRVFPDSSCGRGKAYKVDGIKFQGFRRSEADADSMLCAAGVNGSGDVVDACQGDSGGPLVAGVGEARRLIGVVSWGQECASRLPGVYTRLGSVSEFLIDAGVLPQRAPILAPLVTVTSPKTGVLRIKMVAPADGTAIDAFAASVTNPQTGAIYTCTASPRPGKRTRACFVDGLPPGSVVTVDAISGNGVGSSPVSIPQTVTV